MKKLSFALAALLISGSASAGFYGSLGVGSSIDTEIKSTVSNQDLDSDFGYALAVGYEAPLLPLRVEVESFAFRSEGGDISDAEFTTDGLMLNAYAGLPLGIIVPYIGGGIGEGKSALASSTSTYSTGYNTAYQGMVGAELSLPLLPFSVGLEYRYFDMDTGALMPDTTLQSVLLKARISF